MFDFYLANVIILYSFLLNFNIMYIWVENYIKSLFKYKMFLVLYLKYYLKIFMNFLYFLINWEFLILIAL